MLDNLSQGKFKAKFGQSGANFKFASNKFGPGPYISYQNEDDTVETFYDPLKTFRSNNSFLESDIAKDTSSTDVISGGSLSPKFIFNNQTSPNNIPSVAGAYTAYAIPSTTKVDTTNLDNNKFYPAIVSTPIPFIVTPAASTYSYYNPLTKHSYQQNDYLLDDISSVQNQINSTNA
jgi:hypothetical protein